MDRPVARRRVTPPMLIGGAVSLATLSAIAWMTLHPAERTFRLDASRITISTVSTAPFHDFIPLRGRVVPLVSIVLDAVQGGRVEEVLAEAGQRVVAGQRLIRLSDPTLELDAIARETQVIGQINSQRSLQLSFELTRANDAKRRWPPPNTMSCASAGRLRGGGLWPRRASRRWRSSTSRPTSWPTRGG